MSTRQEVRKNWLRKTAGGGKFWSTAARLHDTLLVAPDAHLVQLIDVSIISKHHEIMNYFYVIIAGAFGGILYAIREKTINLPSRRNGVIELGIIADILFGIGGGLLIFLITPEVPDINKNFGIIKLLSLVIAGGYSGQFLIKKVAANNIKDLAEKTEKTQEHLDAMQEMKERDQKAYKMFYEIIDGKCLTREEINEALKNVSQSIILRGFTLLNDRRKELVFKLFDNCNAPEKQLFSIKKEFERFIPLLEEIIDKERSLDEKEKNLYLHYHYASLAYLYKDINKPDWEKTIKYINKAIELHDKKYKQENIPETYMLNQLLCLINMNNTSEINLCFEKLWQLPGGRYEIVRSNPVITPGLHSWMLKFHPEKIKEQFQYNNYSVYKKNWIELFPEQKDCCIRGC